MSMIPKDGKPSNLPPIRELAARARDGETLQAIAAEYGVAYTTLTSRFSQAGFVSTGETKQQAQRREIREQLGRPADQEWKLEGSCARVDGELWYPEVGSTPHMAKRICQGCDVIDQCLRWALETNERYGVWGGKTAMERRRMKPQEAAA